MTAEQEALKYRSGFIWKRKRTSWPLECESSVYFPWNYEAPALSPCLSRADSDLHLLREKENSTEMKRNSPASASTQPFSGQLSPAALQIIKDSIALQHNKLTQWILNNHDVPGKILLHYMSPRKLDYISLVLYFEEVGLSHKATYSAQSVTVEVYEQKNMLWKSPGAKDLPPSLKNSSHVTMKQRQVYAVAMGSC